MADPVTDLREFFPTYLKRLKERDVDGLGAMYAEGEDAAVWTCIRAPKGNRLAVGRDTIVEEIREALTKYRLIEETYYGPDYTMRGDDHAERYGTYVAVVQKGLKRETYCIVAFEVLCLDPIQGWQYVSDHSIVLSPLITPR